MSYTKSENNCCSVRSDSSSFMGDRSQINSTSNCYFLYLSFNPFPSTIIGMILTIRLIFVSRFFASIMYSAYSLFCDKVNRSKHFSTAGFSLNDVINSSGIIRGLFYLYLLWMIQKMMC